MLRKSDAAKLRVTIHVRIPQKDKYPKHGVVHKIGRRISNADYRLMFSLD